ncbi:MAG: GcrA family cell cycle regulator [Hyphomicrobiaceae bacterium]
MSWTDDRVDLLKKLWSEGLSASQIAGRLGGVTRNAVIGKVHRLGLSGRATTSRMKSIRPRVRTSTPRRQQQRPNFRQLGNPAFRNLYQGEAEPFVPAPEEIDIPLAERKNLQDLTENDCRWPIGDPQHEDFHFCNRGKVPGLPYCEFHSKRAFQPPQARRRSGAGAKPETTPALAKPTVNEPVDA